MRASVGRFVLQRAESFVLRRHLNSLDDLLPGNIDDHKPVEIGHCYVHRVPIRGNHIRPWSATSGNVSGVIHLLQIDQVDLVRAHRAQAFSALCGSLIGRTLTICCCATSTISTLFPSRIGTATYFPSGVTAHWLGRPVSFIVAMVCWVAVSINLSVWSVSTVANNRLPSA